MEPISYFTGTLDSPYHLSVGAAVYNERGEIACHYFDEISGLTDFYILMRETMEPEETIEQAVARGLMEEFGMTAELETFLGSLVQPIDIKGGKAEKTTLYFLCRYLHQDDGLRRVGDPEGGSTVSWMTPEFLIEKMREQEARLQHGTLDESEIIIRAKTYLHSLEESHGTHQ